MNRIYIAVSSFMSGFVILLFSLNIISDMRVQLKDLEIKNMTLESQIDKLEIRRLKTEVNVIGTMYSPTREQCDATPNITADGTRINPKIASNYRYVALSRDLLKRWGGPFDYGEYITVEGTNKGKHDGIWQVRDTMNPKWLKRVDFLMTDGTRPFKYNEIKITKLDS